MRSFRPLRSCGELTAFPNFTAIAVASRAHGYPPPHKNAGVPATPITFQERKRQKMRTRNLSIPFRVTAKELEEIDRKAAKAKLNRTEYLIACALGKQITLVEDLKPLLAEMRRIGNNINQLAKLANMGKIQEIYLEETKESLDNIYVAIYQLARGGDGHWQSS